MIWRRDEREMIVFRDSSGVDRGGGDRRMNEFWRKED